MPEVKTPFIHVYVPQVSISLLKDPLYPPYTLPPAPILPEKAAASQQPVRGGDIAVESASAYVPLSKIPKTPAQDKPADIPLVKTPAAAGAAPPAAAAQAAPAAAAAAAAPLMKKDVSKEPAAKAETVYYTSPGIIEILLDRQGWIYAGEKEGKKGLFFESKENIPGNPGSPGSTLFRFTVRDEGPYKMVFQLQDRSGRSEISEINIKKGAEETLHSEETEAAIDDNNYLSYLSLLSSVGEETGKEGTLEKNEITEKIVEGATLQASVRNYEKAIEILEIITSGYPDYPQMDRIYYLLGQYYEADSIKRNASRSVGYYEKLIDEFPLSSRVYDAQSRIKYLEKHFIHIR